MANGIRMRMKKFTVYRNKWLRGDAPKSMLRNGNGAKCCMGFLASGLGCIGITDKFFFNELAEKQRDKLPIALRPDGDNQDTLLADQIYEINDRCDISDKQREASLKRLFKKAEVIVVFK